MTRLTLNIKRDIDLAVLLPLLNRLGISYDRNEVIPESPSIPLDVNKFLMNGLPEKENFTEWAADWESSREDRQLPR
jgi:hypothetical protein